jgi:hypothetical protein
MRPLLRRLKPGASLRLDGIPARGLQNASRAVTAAQALDRYIHQNIS